MLCRMTSPASASVNMDRRWRSNRSRAMLLSSIATCCMPLAITFRQTIGGRRISVITRARTVPTMWKARGRPMFVAPIGMSHWMLPTIMHCSASRAYDENFIGVWPRDPSSWPWCVLDRTVGGRHGFTRTTRNFVRIESVSRGNCRSCNAVRCAGKSGWRCAHCAGFPSQCGHSLWPAQQGPL